MPGEEGFQNGAVKIVEVLLEVSYLNKITPKEHGGW